MEPSFAFYLIFFFSLMTVSFIVFNRRRSGFGLFRTGSLVFIISTSILFAFLVSSGIFPKIFDQEERSGSLTISGGAYQVVSEEEIDGPLAYTEDTGSLAYLESVYGTDENCEIKPHRDSYIAICEVLE